MGRVHLETFHDVRKRGRGGHEMHMVFQNYVAIDLEAPVLLQEAPTIQENLYRFWPRENREPANDRAGHEVGIFGLEDAVTAPTHGAYSTAKQSFGKCVPKQSLVTRETDFLLDDLKV